MSESDELENCPFCGSGIDNATPHPFPVRFRPGTRKPTTWAARCGNPDCAAEIRAPTAALATERWNRRCVLRRPAPPLKPWTRADESDDGPM